MKVLENEELKKTDDNQENILEETISENLIINVETKDLYENIDNNIVIEDSNNNIENKEIASDTNIKENILDENFSVKLKNFYKKRTNYFHLNIEDLIHFEKNILKLNVKKTIKFLLQDIEDKNFPLILIENFITIENEHCIIFNKKKYMDNEEIIIDVTNKKLFCNTEILNGNLKLFCNLINGIVYHPDIESIDNIDNFDEFKNNIGLKDGILYSDNYLNVNSKVLHLETRNLLIFFDNKEKSIKYFIRSADDWWCNIEKEKLKDLNFLKVKNLNFKI